MLELVKIKKSYKTGDFIQMALKDVSIKFRKNEFVAILGESGSGKTTLLNMIGGLDRYDSGDIIINGKSTKKFKNYEWDAYRNNSIGFIFQSYNLISHISVLANVEMGMTLSGVSAKKRRRKALELLDQVGIKEHSHKKPNQLSGGQMQRVAIARALANNPDIILADEPTGALDSLTSVQIMDLIKEIAKNKLVIMVTHNSSLATEYANRVIEVKDGEVLNDSNPVADNEDQEKYSIRKTAMSFLTALKLSFNNIMTKKGRTLLTAFASSIGILGIALILSLSNGLDKQIKSFEKDSLSNMPIMISESAMALDEESMHQMVEHNNDASKEYPTALEVYPEEPMREQMIHTNILSKEFIDYVKKIDDAKISGISFQSATSLNVVTKISDGNYKAVNNNVFGQLPHKIGSEDRYEFLENTYDLMYGSYPKSKDELVIIIDNKNYVSKDILDALGFDSSKEAISFEEIIGKEFKLVNNNDFYKSLGHIYTPNLDYETLYNNSNATTLKITGIIRGKKDKEMITSFSSGVGYTEDLIDYVIEQNKTSNIVKAQENANYNIMSGAIFNDSDNTKDTMLSYLGFESSPYMIQIFSKDFSTKEDVLEYLDKYNLDKVDEDKIIYTDTGNLIASLSENLLDVITWVLVGFSAISLIVSSIMIAIITYISVLERTREIGILRALGARKKDISRVFNAETFIVGITSGLIGIGIARLLLFPINAILYNIVELKNIAILNPIHALLLLVISLILTLLGGFIPAIMASRKDPVESLRTE